MLTGKGFLDSWFTFIGIMLACLLLAAFFAQGKHIAKSVPSEHGSGLYGAQQSATK